MHPKVEEALQEIDAAFFSSDTFANADDLARIKSFLGRWQDEVVEIEKFLKSREQTGGEDFESFDEADLEPPCDTDDADAPTQEIDGFEVGGGIPPGRLLVLSGECSASSRAARRLRELVTAEDDAFEAANRREQQALAGSSFLDECMYGNDM
jgi:hypothetical protein